MMRVYVWQVGWLAGARRILVQRILKFLVKKLLIVKIYICKNLNEDMNVFFTMDFPQIRRTRLSF